MRIVWGEAKRRSNLRKHGFDFDDAAEVFSGFTYTVEDDRFIYEERRFITLGLLKDTVVTIVPHRNRRGDTHHIHEKGDTL